MRKQILCSSTREQLVPSASPLHKRMTMPILHKLVVKVSIKIKRGLNTTGGITYYNSNRCCICFFVGGSYVLWKSAMILWHGCYKTVFLSSNGLMTLFLGVARLKKCAIREVQHYGTSTYPCSDGLVFV